MNSSYCQLLFYSRPHLGKYGISRDRWRKAASTPRRRRDGRHTSHTVWLMRPDHVVKLIVGCLAVTHRWRAECVSLRQTTGMASDQRLQPLCRKRSSQGGRESRGMIRRDLTHLCVDHGRRHTELGCFPQRLAAVSFSGLKGQHYRRFFISVCQSPVTWRSQM